MLTDYLNEAAGGSTGPTDLARILGVPRETLYRWLAAGRVNKTSDVERLVKIWERHNTEPAYGRTLREEWRAQRNALIAGLCGL